MDLKLLLSQKTSFQRNTWADISKEVSILEVLNEIRSNNLKDSVEKLRVLFKDDLESYKVEKLRLPAVTFCGAFDVERKKDKIKTYNLVIVLDIDKLSDDEVKKVRADLEKDEYAFTFWNSPSDYGVKGLVALEFGFAVTDENRDNAHKSAFVKLSKHYLEKYNIELDSSGSDTTRLCFLSYDTKLVLKEDYKPFSIEESDLQTFKPSKESEAEIKVRSTKKKDRLFNPSGRNINRDRQAIKFLVKFLTRKKFSITSDYESWYRVAYALANTFTFDVGQKHYLELCRLDGARYNEGACINMLTYCYENNNGGIKYPTIEYLAKQKGYINKNIGEGVFRTEA